MSAIERLGNPKDRRQPAYFVLQFRRELREIRIFRIGWRFSVVARHIRDHQQLILGEAAKVGVANQVVGVSMMSAIADVHAAFMKDGGDMKKLARVVMKSVQLFRLI